MNKSFKTLFTLFLGILFIIPTFTANSTANAKSVEVCEQNTPNGVAFIKFFSNSEQYDNREHSFTELERRVWGTILECTLVRKSNNEQLYLKILKKSKRWTSYGTGEDRGIYFTHSIKNKSFQKLWKRYAVINPTTYIAKEKKKPTQTQQVVKKETEDTEIESLKIKVRPIEQKDIEERGLKKNTKGLVITKIAKDSPFKINNLVEEGNIIVEVQKKAIKSIGDLNMVVNAVLASSEKLYLFVYDNQNQNKYMFFKSSSFLEKNLIAKKEPKKNSGYLGIRMQFVTSEIAEAVELDSTEIKDIIMLQRVLAKTYPGKNVVAKILRNKKIISKKVTLGDLELAKTQITKTESTQTQAAAQAAALAQAAAEAAAAAQAQAAAEAAAQTQQVAEKKITWIGVRVQEVTKEIADVAQCCKTKKGSPKGTFGALVASVKEGSPADKAGIKVGDIILSFFSWQVISTKQLSEFVATSKPGQKIFLDIWRDRKVFTTIVTVGSKPTQTQ